MKIDINKKNFFAVITMEGRFDSFGAQELNNVLDLYIDSNIQFVIIDMPLVDYISSAGLRVIMTLEKRMKSKKGEVFLVGITDYCNKILEVTGFIDFFMQFPVLAEAELHCQNLLQDSFVKKKWVDLANASIKHGRLKLINRAKQVKPELIQYGLYKNIQKAQVTQSLLRNTFLDRDTFFIGYGGMGPSAESTLPLVGHMMTAGGAAAWQPADGHSVPDYIIQALPNSKIPFYSAYDICLSGEFSNVVFFESNTRQGAPFSDLCIDLFRFTELRSHQDNKGIIGFVMLAELSVLNGKTLKKAPVQTPGQGSDTPSADCNRFDSAHSTFKNVTAAIIGLGVDFSRDLAEYDQDILANILPANLQFNSERIRLTNCFATVYGDCRLSEKPVDFNEEFKRILETQTIEGVCELDIETTLISKSLIGMYYIQKLDSIGNVAEEKEDAQTIHQDLDKLQEENPVKPEVIYDKHSVAQHSKLLVKKAYNPNP